jgi:type IV fimbrial biogenesis protein FimT
MTTTISSYSHRSRSGVTLIEAMIVIAIVAILVGMVAPAVSRQVTHSRVNDAAHVLAGHLEQAVTLAGRQRRPVRVSVDGAQKAMVIADRASGTIISRHAYGPQSEFKLETLSSSPATVDILPQGVATSAATFVVRIGSYARQVTITRAGLVRLQP